ncbi:MAG TPA: META domain-containing protein [Solirubrobacter sp.]|nr:META domain-containing protein [Solirubrobacter sp.]
MRRHLLLLLAAALLVSACGGDDDDSGLRDAPWALTSGIDVNGWEAFAPSATFADGHVAGSTGCNRFTAAYEVDGSTLELDHIASTLMGCPAPADAVERAFLDALKRVRAWRISDGELQLLDGDDRELLRFGVPTLRGAWKATMINTGDALKTPAGTITATFGEDGTLTGSGGCNTYRAAFKAERGKLEIDPPAGTRKACTEPGVGEQEQAFLSALPLATGYRIEGDHLSLLAADGTFVATFERA